MSGFLIRHPRAGGNDGEKAAEMTGAKLREKGLTPEKAHVDLLSTQLDSEIPDYNLN